MFESLRHFDHELRIIDPAFGHVSMPQVDAAFVVFFVTRDVVATNQVIQRRTRSTHRTSAVVPRLHMRHSWADSLDDAEDLVPENQEVVPFRSAAVERFVNLHIGGVNAHLQCANQHPAPVGDITEFGLREFSNVGGVFDARTDCQRTHDAFQKEKVCVNGLRRADLGPVSIENISLNHGIGES